jgi:integrase
MICYVFKRKRANGTRRAPLFYGRFRLSEAKTSTTVALHTTDERVARKRLDAIILQKQRECEGLTVPASLLKASRTPILDHLDAYTADLRARGCADMYVYNIERLTTRLCMECGWMQPVDITAQGFTAWRSNQGEQRAAKTLNEYYDALAGLLRWLMGQGKLTSNPLSGVHRTKTEGAERRKRRALTDDELRRLFAVAGPRRIIYLVAAGTGLRRGELAAMEWGDVNLDGLGAHILARASTTKNRRDARLPLHPDLAEALRSYRPVDAAQDDRVFRAIPEMATVRKDLEKAGIPYKNAAGRQADFHSLRHTFATRLMRAQVNPRVAMQLMRHSEMRLTAKIYTDADQIPTDEAVLSLPSLTKNGTQLCTQTLVISGPSVAGAGKTNTLPESSEPADSKGNRHAAA